MVVIDIIWETNSNLYQLPFNKGSIQDTLSSSVKVQLFCLINYTIYWDFNSQFSSGNLRFNDFGKSSVSCKKMHTLPTSSESYQKWYTVSLSKLWLSSLTHEQGRKISRFGVRTNTIGRQLQIHQGIRDDKGLGRYARNGLNRALFVVLRT